MYGKPRPWSSFAPRWCRLDIRSDRCRCPREFGWRCRELETLTCASSAVVAALVVLGLWPFVLGQIAAQARIRQLLPVIELVTDRTVSAARRIASRRQCVDQADCRVRRPDLCLHDVSYFEEHFQMQEFPMVPGWMWVFGMMARPTPA